ncbi:hypothetical protein SAMN05216368_1096 [Cryobacterium flavum]|nr:hypothetical protein SAMN05216368_1096 [Cryobacterium flavum]
MLSGCSAAAETPDEIVQSFLEAVQRGDAVRAVELINPGVPDEQRVLLTDAVLKKSDSITNIVVLIAGSSAASSDDMYSEKEVPVSATYDVNGETAEVQFLASKTTDGWMVKGGYATIAAPFGTLLPKLAVNDAKVTPANSDDGALLVFPGTYEVAVADNTLVSSEPIELSTASDNVIDWQFTPAKAVVEQFESELATFISACFAEPADTRDHACPNWSYVRSAAVAEVKWELRKAPTFALSVTAETLGASQKTATEQHLSYTYNGGVYNDTPTVFSEDLEEMSMIFSARVEDGLPVFKPESLSREYSGDYIYSEDNWR